MPKVKMDFKQKPVPFKELESNIKQVLGKPISPGPRKYFFQTPGGRSLSDVHPKGSYFNFAKVHPDRVCPTITASEGRLMHYKEPYFLHDQVIIGIQSFPQDYDFQKENPTYVCGMSVPPLMMRGVASEVIKQCFRRDGEIDGSEEAAIG